MRHVMRALIVSAAALLAVSCGLFLDDFSKGEGPVDTSGDVDTDSDTDTDGGTGSTPCEGVDLSADPCCDIEDSCGWSVFTDWCDCPTCPWDEADCGGGGDAGADTEGDTEADAAV